MVKPKKTTLVRWAALVWLVFAGALIVSTPAIAQPADDGEPAKADKDLGDNPQTGDEPADQAETLPAESQASKETDVTGGTLMLAAYIVFWVMIFGYIGVVMRHQRQLDDEIAGLERRMDRVLDNIEE